MYRYKSQESHLIFHDNEVNIFQGMYCVMLDVDFRDMSGTDCLVAYEFNDYGELERLVGEDRVEDWADHSRERMKEFVAENPEMPKHLNPNKYYFVMQEYRACLTPVTQLGAVHLLKSQRGDLKKSRDNTRDTKLYREHLEWMDDQMDHLVKVCKREGFLIAA